jgi:hypothetical protein
LGDFSPFGRLFTLGDCFENYRRGPNLWTTKLCLNFDKKIDWATFWAIFSQTYLTSLTRGQFGKSLFLSRSDRNAQAVATFVVSKELIFGNEKFW